MANLTDSDFIIFSEISYLNSARAALNPPLAPLQKNPSVSKGDVTAPQPQEDLYAHNFLNLIDWFIAFSFINPNNRGSESSRAEIVPYVPPFQNMSFSELQSIFSNDAFYWTGPEYAQSFAFNPLLVKSNIPSNFQAQDSTADTLNISFTDYLAALAGLTPSAVHQGTSIISVSQNQAKELLAYDFTTPFYSFSTYADMLKDGCKFFQNHTPQVESSGWNTQFSSDPQGAYSPYGPTGNGKYRRIQKHTTGSTYDTMSQTSTPTYQNADMFLANSAYVRKSGSTVIATFKTAQQAIDFSAVVKLYQKVVDDDSPGDPIVKSKILFSHVPISSIGSIYLPQNSSSVYFRLDPAKLSSQLSSMESTLDLDPTQYSSGNDYNLFLESNVAIGFLASPKNLPA